ncbi:MAG: hypothetical protein AB1482_12590 [Pseudomonadota bacterium]
MKRIAANQIVALLCLIAGIAGCGKPESPPSPAAAPAQPQESQKPAERGGYPPGDVRSHFVAKDQPLLGEGAQVKLWAGSREKDKPEVLVKELDYPTLEYAPDGTLYFIGDHQDAIVAIKPNKSSEVIARSGTYAGAKTDDGEPVYNTFEGLSFTPDGNLLTLKNGVYPAKVDLSSGRVSFLNFVLPSGERIEGPENYESFYKEYFFERLPYTASIQASDEGQIIIAAGDSKVSGWFAFKAGEAIKEIRDPLHLPIDAYMINAQQGEQNLRNFILGPDGYIYAVELGQGKQDPDRVIRIGDSGLSSLRKDATRVTIAEFKHGELTGSIAFSPKGELAVGARNRIYLVSPGSSGKLQPGKMP